MRIRTGLGFVSAGVAVGAAVAFPATAASAGTVYKSTATAVAPQITIAGTAIPLVTSSVTATDENSPARASLGISAIEKALASTPLGSALQATLPTGADVSVASASASASGTSSATAGLVAGDPTAGNQPEPITLSLSLADLPGLNVPTSPPASGSKSSPGSNGPLSGLTKGLSGKKGSGSTASPAPSSPLPLSDFKIVLTVAGPEASCTAGPKGGPGSDFTASADLARVTADIQENGKSILPTGPIVVDAGQILGQLNKLGLPSQLLRSLNGVTSLPAGAIGLTINPGSTTGAGAGPETTATAGELNLSIGSTDLLHFVGAKATCGANLPAATTKKTSGEQPLSGIQTDEGRSGTSGTALWLGAAGGAAILAGGTTGGVAFWRRRRSS